MMNTDIDKMRKILNGRATNEQDLQIEFIKIVAQLPADNVTKALSEVTKGIQMPVLDHLLIEVLHQRIKTDPLLVTAIQDDLLKKGGDTEFWLALLGVFDDLLCNKSGYEQEHQQFLEKLAAIDARPHRLRACAIRRFFLKPGPASIKKLSPFFNSREPWLLNAAAYHIANWQEKGIKFYPNELKAIYALYKQNPDQVVKMPAVLRILSGSTEPEAQKILDHLCTTVKDEDRARLISVLAGRLTPKQLLALTNSVFQDWDLKTELALQSLLINDPKRLEDLYQPSEEQRYLYGLSLLSDGKSKLNEISRLEDIQSGSSAVSMEAGYLLHDIKAFHPKVRTRARQNLNLHDKVIRYLETGRLRASEIFRAVSPKVADGFNTGFHKADALYIDLGPGFSIAGQHWHCGVYLGFNLSRARKDGSLSIAQAGQFGFSPNSVDFDCIEIVDVSTTFESPDISVADAMKTLRNNLILGMQKTEDVRVFHGGRRTPGITAEKAEKIAATAVSFLNKGINYTAFNMLKQKWLEWEGKVEDIRATRCDGVVEFAYEKNGEIVCRGLEQNRANISRAGVKNLANHNDLHLGSLEPGELCPRAQAGDQGDSSHQGELNSRMSSAEGPTLPQIDEFYVTPKFYFFPPTIFFKITAQRYDYVYVRLTVRKDNAPFKFVRTLSLRGWEEPIGADWRFVRVHTGKTITAFWRGETTDINTGYYEQDGNYEFRLVAVDLAGNVSELHRATVNITWS